MDGFGQGWIGDFYPSLGGYTVSERFGYTWGAGGVIFMGIAMVII